jgi:threonine synthase
LRKASIFTRASCDGDLQSARPPSYNHPAMAASPFRAAFRCLAGCAGEHPLDAPLYRCPTCGGLLEVHHDRTALATRSAREWTTLFDERYRRAPYPYSSGVWGKKEWVAPHVADENVVSTDEGGTNLFAPRRFARELGVDELWVKQCGLSHTGSFKDLGMTVLVSVVKQRIAEGKPVRAVACASTGDTSAALAAYCAAADLKAVVILPRGKISAAQLVQPLANGAIVLALDTDFDGCMRVVKRLAEEDGLYLANSMNALRLEGQKTVAIEIAQQLGWTAPDWVVVPGGNLGNVSALSAGFDLMVDLGVLATRPRLVVAQAERADPLYRSFQAGFASFTPRQAETTLASAIQIGDPVSAPRAIAALKKCDGVVEHASEQELCDAAAWADRSGLFNCPHTGVALAALIKLVRRGVIRRDQRVVVLSTANGLKFADFKTRYHEGALPGIIPTHRNAPIETSDRYADVRAALLPLLD